VVPGVEAMDVDPTTEAGAVSAPIRGQVVEFGWAAVAVDTTPPFAYMDGLWRMADHSELVITGSLPRPPTGSSTEPSKGSALGERSSPEPPSLG
jgi:hypothetical protein